MEFEHNGKKITVRDDPLTGDELKASKYFHTVISNVLGSVSDQDKGMELEEYIKTVAKTNPEKFGDYISEITMWEEFETILLSTSLTKNDILELPSSVRQQLFEKCKEALGGTARDFFSKSKKNLVSEKTRTMKELLE